MYLIASQVLHCCAVIAPNQDVAFMLARSCWWVARRMAAASAGVWMGGLRMVVLGVKVDGDRSHSSLPPTSDRPSDA